MHRGLKYGVIIIAMIALWYAIWGWMMAEDVAHVRDSIDFQNQQIKTINRNAVLKVDDVVADGFPFHFQVRVERPTLSVIAGKKTYGVSFQQVVLIPAAEPDKGYVLQLPENLDALYAADGAAPENYRVYIDAAPDILLRSERTSATCKEANVCSLVTEDSLINSYALSLPKRIRLHIELSDSSSDAGFQLEAVPAGFHEIPRSVEEPLVVFVGILREAIIHNPHGVKTK